MKLAPLCRRLLIGTVTAMVGLVMALPAHAADKPKTQKPRQIVPTGEEDAPSAAAPARRSAVAEPSGEEALEQMTNRSSDGLQVRTLPSGAEALDLEGRFMHVSMAVPRVDGSKGVTCTTNPKALAKAAPAPVPSKTPIALEEK